VLLVSYEKKRRKKKKSYSLTGIHVLLPENVSDLNLSFVTKRNLPGIFLFLLLLFFFLFFMRKEDNKTKNLAYLLHFFDSIHTHILISDKENKSKGD
jgi:hypothetical protein